MPGDERAGRRTRTARDCALHLPIIITTGYIRADDVAAARELGVRDVILKPDTIDELAAIVHRNLT